MTTLVFQNIVRLSSQGALSPRETERGFLYDHSRLQVEHHDCFYKTLIFGIDAKSGSKRLEISAIQMEICNLTMNWVINMLNVVNCEKETVIHFHFAKSLGIPWPMEIHLCPPQCEICCLNYCNIICFGAKIRGELFHIEPQQVSIWAHVLQFAKPKKKIFKLLWKFASFCSFLVGLKYATVKKLLVVGRYTKNRFEFKLGALMIGKKLIKFRNQISCILVHKTLAIKIM